MEAVYDFIRAALPWVLIGLSVAVLLAKNGNQKDKKKEDYGVEGMCLGMCFGVALGGNMGIGMSLGMLIGLTVGSFIKKEGKRNEE